MKKQLFAMSLCLLLLTGCWDKTEIEDRAYVITLGVDAYDMEEEVTAQEDGNNRVTISLAFADMDKRKGQDGGSGSEERVKAKLFSGETLASAMRLADNYGTKKTYYGQTKTIVFGKELLEDQELFKEVLDAMERSRELNMRIIVLSAPDRASEVVNSAMAGEDPSGLAIWNFYRNNAKNVAATHKVDLESLIIDLREEGDGILPMVSPEKDGLGYGGAAILGNYALKGYLTDKEERGILWASGMADGAIVSASYENTMVPMEVIRSNCSMEFTEENDRLKCIISSTVYGSIEGWSVGEDRLFGSNHIQSLEKVFEAIIKDEILNTIETTKTIFQSDALRLMEQLRKKNRTLYDKYENHLKEAFSTMKVEADVNVDIRSIGVIR